MCEHVESPKPGVGPTEANRLSSLVAARWRWAKVSSALMKCSKSHFRQRLQKYAAESPELRLAVDWSRMNSPGIRWSALGLQLAASTSGFPGKTRLGECLTGASLATREAVYNGDRVSVTLTINPTSPFRAGVVNARFKRAITLYVSIVNVNSRRSLGALPRERAAQAILHMQENPKRSIRNMAGPSRFKHEGPMSRDWHAFASIRA